MSIVFTSMDVSIPKFSRKKIKSVLLETARQENIEIERVAYHFCSDSYLITLNKKYLKHSTYTDILTFDYSKSNFISGEIYISTERVKENASLYKVSFYNELSKVIIHGLLHLCGYKDKTSIQKKQMRYLEDKYARMLF